MRQAGGGGKGGEVRMEVGGRKSEVGNAPPKCEFLDLTFQISDFRSHISDFPSPTRVPPVPALGEGYAESEQQAERSGFGDLGECGG